MSGNRRKIILYISFALLICTFCIFALCACNNGSDNVKTDERDYGLYFSSISYSEEDETIYAVVTISGDEENKLSSNLKWISETYALDTWYNRQDVEMTLNPSQVFEEVDELITKEERLKDGVEYNRLKVVLRYDTIYKSIKSDGDVIKNGRYYLHRFYLNEESESETYYLWLKSQNTANWYVILIACGIIFVAVLIGVSAAIKGGIWQKGKKKNE